MPPWSLLSRCLLDGEAYGLAIDGMKGVVMDNQQRIEDLRAIAARGGLCQIGAHTSRVHAKRRQHIANMYGARVRGHADPVFEITA